MKYCLAFMLVFFSLNCDAQFKNFSEQLFFKRFSTEQGLSQASVNCILRDSKGFMWFGTDDGLNRFDGNQFKVFRSRFGDSTSLIGNTVQALWEDALGRIWVGTTEGLSRFDGHLEKFQTMLSMSSGISSCADFYYDEPAQRLWMANGLQGVSYIDLTNNSIHRLNHPQLQFFQVLQIEKIGAIIYLGTSNNGVVAIDSNTQTVTNIDLSEPHRKNNVNFAIRAMLTQNDILWIGTEGAGLKRLDTKDGSIQHFSQQRNQLSDNKVWSIAAETDRLWVGTDGGGVTMINLKTNQTSFYKHSYYKSRTISSNTIRSIHKDRTGDLWFGTFNGGVNYLPNFNIKFHTFQKDPEDPTSLSHNAILSFHERDDGTLLIGTDGGGLNYLKDGKFYRYKFPPGVEVPNVILSIKEIENGGILLGTYQQGLYYIRPDKKVSHYKYDPTDTTSITCNIIWDMEEDYEGNVWLATEVGLNLFDPFNFRFTNYRNKSTAPNPNIFTNEFTQTILIDPTYTLWTGYFAKLQSYDLTTGEIHQYTADTTVNKEIPNKSILSLHLDKKDDNIAWFSGFGGGLVKIDLRKKYFSLISEEDGLPNSLIFSVQTDAHGHVWLSTNEGIVRYNPHQKIFHLFDTDFGVNVAPFKDNAGFSTYSGYLLFGGTNGFTAFWPTEVNFQKSNLNVTFTGFQIFNKNVPIDSTILTKSISETQKIKLHYDQAKFLSFEFSAPQFLSPSTIQYHYMLEGFEDQWHILDAKRITLTNLLPGKYKLRVKAGFNSGIVGRESVLEIHVTPAWWRTWYAGVAFLLLIGGLAYAFFRYRTYRLKARKIELEKIVTEQNQEIRHKNNELAEQNKKLSKHNEQLLAHRNTISVQNTMLFEAQEQLKEVNQSLENQVQQRTEKLNETISQLNKTIKELDAFMYSASHDLVSPLKSILGLVDLSKREKTNVATRTYLDHIEKSVLKLEDIIRTLMQHSFNTKAEINIEPVDLTLLTRETISELHFMDESKKITFLYELDGAVVNADGQRLKIILSNLISNAVKYADPDKKTNHVKLKFNSNSHNWSLAVSDNGIGIDKDRLCRIFDMFYRATESAKGSGLGLYIVKDTIDRLNGQIHVDSEPGEGTAFTISFPIN